MNIVLLVGVVLSVVGLAGYAFGVVVAYPGRAFSVTALMVGLTLAAIGRTTALEGAA